MKKYFLETMLTLLLVAWALLAATMLASGTARADHARAFAPASTILVPPKTYDPWVKGNAYGGKLTIVNVPHSQVYAKCTENLRGAGNIGPNVLACAKRDFPKKGSCTVVLATGMPADLYKAVRRHEIAHCKGWRHNTTVTMVEKRVATGLADTPSAVVASPSVVVTADEEILE